MKDTLYNLRRLYTNISNNIDCIIDISKESLPESEFKLDYESLAVISDINIIVGGIKEKINKVID